MAMIQSDSFSAETRSLLTSNDLKQSNPRAYANSLTRRILELEIELLALGRQRNSCVPVNRLPPEVLARIFRIVRSLPAASLMHWIAVSHVCVYWRDVALECTKLWTRVREVAFKHPGLVEALLSRSGNAPLSINMGMSTYARKMDVLLPQIIRTRSLNLDDDCDNDDDSASRVLWGLAGLSAPALELLMLSGHSKNQKYTKWTKMYLPASLLGGGCPSIRFLDVGNYKVVDWKSLPLGAGLRNLRLSLGGDDASGRCVPLNEFLSCIKEMLYLETLDLDCIFIGDYPQDWEKPSDLVTLPSLKALQFCDSVDTLSAFMEATRFPKDTKVVLQPYDIPEDKEIERLLDGLKNAWDGDRVVGDGAPGLVGSLARTKSHYKVGSVEELHVFHYRVYFAPLDFSGSPRLNLKFSDGRGELELNCLVHNREGLNEQSLYCYFRDIGTTFDLTNLKNLTIFASDPFPESIWESMFAPLADLERIRFYRTPVDSFLTWIRNDHAIATTRAWIAENLTDKHPGDGDETMEASSGEGESDHSKATCSSCCACKGGKGWKAPPPGIPNLKRLELVRVDPEFDEDDEWRLSDDLETALGLRALALSPIQEVRLERCEWVTIEGYVKLSNISPWVNVVWDGAPPMDVADEEGEGGGD